MYLQSIEFLQFLQAKLDYVANYSMPTWPRKVIQIMAIVPI